LGHLPIGELIELIELGEHEVTREEIIGFASQWDPLPFHTDLEFGRGTVFGDVIGSGCTPWPSSAPCGVRRVSVSGDYRREAIRSINLTSPLRPDTTVRATVEIESVTPHSVQGSRSARSAKRCTRTFTLMTVQIECCVQRRGPRADHPQRLTTRPSSVPRRARTGVKFSTGEPSRPYARRHGQRSCTGEEVGAAGTRHAPDSSPAKSPRRHLMENEVLEHATRLFAERGFAGTSLQDVADAMGLKRPAIYYYFKSKDALLDRLIEEATSGPAQDLIAIAAQSDQDAARRMHAIAYRIVEWVVAHTDRFLLLVKSESDLSPASAKKFNDGRRAALDAVRTVIEEGVESGEFRPVDPSISGFGIWGICNWVAWWYQPEGTDTVASIANQLADMAVSSLQPVDQRTRKTLSPQSALAALREDLGQLEKALNVDRSPRSSSS